MNPFKYQDFLYNSIMGEPKVIGMVGLGKLGLPCLLAMEKHGGHSVIGFDSSSEVIADVMRRRINYWEEDVNNYLQESQIEVVSTSSELVKSCDVIFVAVPTPHEKDFEGLTPIPEGRKNFSYEFLESAIQDIATGLELYPDRNPLIVVISTVLPGTMQELVLPRLKAARSDFRFAYNPYFIAMGTTIWDFLNPEFILIGARNKKDISDLKDVYEFLNPKFVEMQIESAELTKVAYNTYIGFKIVFANALAEITSEKGGDVDEVTNALGEATQRLMSGKYLSAGMADGGGCHPRDQIAMSFLAREASLSVDIFEFIAKSRDKQTERQADLIIGESEKMNLPIVVLGKAYKSNAPLINGSPALLLGHFLSQKGIKFETYDPWVDGYEQHFELPSVFFIATKHDAFKTFKAPKGSLIIDPWGYFERQSEVHVIYPGRQIGISVG
jgi:UDPglucose 6-dehydrogenase